MLSRVANSLYWMARYLERAENTARFLSVTHSYAQEIRVLSHAAADQCWVVAWDLLAGEGEPDPNHGITFRRLAFDEALPNSLLSLVGRCRENARGIRDVITSEMWVELNVLYLMLQQEARTTPSEASELSLLQRVRNASHLFQGLREHTMSRTDEWHFLGLGLYMERADLTNRILGAMYAHPALVVARDSGQNIDMLHLSTTLRACTAFETYSRSEYAMTAERVAAFLLLDNCFPRSVEFCVHEVGTSLHAISGSSRNVFTNEAEQISGRLVAQLRFARIEEIVSTGILPYLGGVSTQLGQLGRAIREEYFR